MIQGLGDAPQHHHHYHDPWWKWDGLSGWTLAAVSATPRDYLPDVWMPGAPKAVIPSYMGKEGFAAVSSLPGGSVRRFVRLALQVASMREFNED